MGLQKGTLLRPASLLRHHGKDALAIDLVSTHGQFRQIRTGEEGKGLCEACMQRVILVGVFEDGS
jgi:hypothetical protein